MDRTVAHMNVEHYRRLLAVETDEARRQVLLRLLAEEEAKISDGQNRKNNRRSSVSACPPKGASESDAHPAAPWWKH